MDDMEFDIDTISEEGEQVYSLYWDSGGPGGGADYELIYKWGGYYVVALSYEDELMGPFDTLREAIEAGELNYVNDATKSISSTELSASEIAALLRTDQDAPPERLMLNDEEWRRAADGTWVPQGT